MVDSHPLRRWRREHRVTGEEFGRRIGVTKSTVSSYESGRRIPHLSVIMRIEQETAGAISARDFAPSSILVTARPEPDQPGEAAGGGAGEDGVGDDQHGLHQRSIAPAAEAGQ